MKKLLIILFIFATYSSCVYAEEIEGVAPKVYSIVYADNLGNMQEKVETIILDNSLYIPLRYISERMGYKVDWVSDGNKILISEDGVLKAEINLNSESGIVNNDGTIFINSKLIPYKLNIRVVYDIENKKIILEEFKSIDEFKTVEDLDVYAYARELYNNQQYATIISHKVVIEDGSLDKFNNLFIAVHDTVNCSLNITPDMNLRYQSILNGKTQKLIGFSTVIIYNNITETEQIELDKFANSVIEKTNKFNSDIEKLKVVNAEILDHINYDFEIDIQETTYKDSVHTAYGAVTTKKAVCTGYTNLFTYIVEKLDIPVIKVTGSNNIGDLHIWNAVYVEKNGKVDWYYVDTTWNDTDKNVHFLTTDKQDKKYKKWDKKVEELTKEFKYPEIKEKEFIKTVYELQ